jgi:hypothetical protein
MTDQSEDEFNHDDLVENKVLIMILSEIRLASLVYHASIVPMSLYVTVKLIIFLFQAVVGVGEKQGKGNQQKVKPPSEDEGDDQSDSSDDEDDEDGHRGALEG